MPRTEQRTNPVSADDGAPRRNGTGLAVAVGIAATAAAGWLAVATLDGARAVPWVIARASGLASYVLLLTLVTTGLLLAHPWARRLRRPSPTTRLALHVSLATFTLLFTVLHVVVVATDPWSGVGWRGALVPLASGYRPVAVTLGLLALWAGLVTGVTARLAGRVAGRVWWPVHRVAALTFVLVWTHSVLAGTDTAALRGCYAVSGLAVVALALSRHAARTAADRREAHLRALAGQPSATEEGRR